MDLSEEKINRRTFMRRSAGVVAGASAMTSTALSYARIVGANDRISLGHVGVGNRGRGLEFILSHLKDKQNVETTAVCDLWKVNRERAVATGEKTYGRAPRAFMHLEDLLASKDLDAVIISTPEHQHSPMLKMVAESDRHAYVEKPMGNVLEEAKAARGAVLERKLIVQVGTQRRSEPYQVEAREWYKRGVTGDVQQIRNRLELPRPTLAGATGGQADPRAGHRLAKVADDEALSSLRPTALFRIPALQGILKRHS